MMSENRQVWKYNLGAAVTQTIDMPCDAHILCAQMQLGIVCLWAIGSLDAEHKARKICVVGTGHNINPSQKLIYIDTIQMPSFGLVWHIFEEL
jgi:hypothetical protein